MEVTQLKSFINEVQTIALGDEALPINSGETIDTSDLVSLGEKVLESDTDKEKWYNSLFDRIGKTWIAYRIYNAKSKDNMFYNELEFGAVLQKIQTMKLAKSDDNASWKDSYTKTAGKDTTDISQLLFSKIGTWAVEDKVIYDYQLKTAFTSWANMGSFVEMVFADMRNALEFQIEQCIKLTRATCYAQSFKAVGGKCTRNLLAEYNTFADEAITSVTSALHSKDFLRYANAEILKVVKRVQSMKSLYNSAGADRFTPDPIVEIAVDYASASATYLESDTFHKELISLPNYDEIDEWISGGTDNSTNMAIALTDESETEIIKTCVIGAVRDREGCGVMVKNVRTKSEYFPIAERTVYSHKADYGTFVDGSQNCVVFYLEYVEEPEVNFKLARTATNCTIAVTDVGGNTISDGDEALIEGETYNVEVTPTEGYTVATISVNEVEKSLIEGKTYFVANEDIELVATGTEDSTEE